MTVEEAIKELKYRIKLTKRACLKSMSEQIKVFEMAIEALEEVEQYRALGTVEELKEAKEKQIAKKPVYYTFGKEKYPKCPCCGDNWNLDEYGDGMVHCWECGQAIDWSEGE